MGALDSAALKKHIIEDCLVMPVLDWKSQLGQGSVDLRLGPRFLVASRRQLGILDAMSLDFMQMVNQYQEQVTVRFGQALTLHPGDFALGSSLEYLNFPPNFVGYVAARSSWARVGLSIATAMVLGPGFKGCLTLGLANVSTVPIQVYPGWRVAQLVVHRLEGKRVKKNSPQAEAVASMHKKYRWPVGPEVSRLDDDPEARVLRFRRLPLVIGVCGHDQAGKATVEKTLVEELGLVALPLSRYVRVEMGRRGRPPFPECFHQVSHEIRSLHGRDHLAQRALGDMATGPGVSGFVVRGIRHVDEIEFLKKESRFYLLVILASKKLRRLRLEQSRGERFARICLMRPDPKSVALLRECIAAATKLRKKGQAFILVNRKTSDDLRRRTFEAWVKIRAAEKKRLRLYGILDGDRARKRPGPQGTGHPGPPRR